jgi:hypothetical protein
MHFFDFVSLSSADLMVPGEFQQEMSSSFPLLFRTSHASFSGGSSSFPGTLNDAMVAERSEWSVDKLGSRSSANTSGRTSANVFCIHRPSNRSEDKMN